MWNLRALPVSIYIQLRGCLFQALIYIQFSSIVRAFLIEEQKIVKRVLKAQQVEAKKGKK